MSVPSCRYSLQKALRQSRAGVRRKRMTSFKLFGAVLILSAAFATPVFAQASAGLPQLPGDYAFFYPNDDFGPSAVQPPRVVVAQARRPTRPHRAPISGLH